MYRFFGNWMRKQGKALEKVIFNFRSSLSRLLSACGEGFPLNHLGVFNNFDSDGYPAL